MLLTGRKSVITFVQRNLNILKRGKKTQKHVDRSQLKNGGTVIVSVTIDSAQCPCKQCPYSEVDDL